MKSGINSETMGGIMKHEQNYENLWKIMKILAKL